MLDELIECDKLWRQHLTRLNELRRERNRITPKLQKQKRRAETSPPLVSRAKAVDGEITELEKQVADYEEKVHNYLMLLPNLLHESVPIGKDEFDNVTVRTWGEPPKFSFQPKDHIDLGLSLDIMDVERAGKIAGARFFYLKRKAYCWIWL
jgi:seryl-tRNA synthetase